MKGDGGVKKCPVMARQELSDHILQTFLRSVESGGSKRLQEQRDTLSAMVSMVCYLSGVEGLEKVF